MTPQKLHQEYADNYPSSIRLLAKRMEDGAPLLILEFVLRRVKYFRQVDGDDHYNAENMPAYIDALRNSDAGYGYYPLYYI